jgi:D-3-phosphoglycerate dehydrogenase
VVVVVDHRFDDLDVERAVLAPVGAELCDARGLKREDVLCACADADAILVGARFRFDADAIGRLTRCQAIVRYGIGFETIDTESAAAAGIWVAYVPDYCIEEVADHALAMLLALNRRLVKLDALVRGGRWGVPSGLAVRRLSSCTLGVIGFGRIGEAVGRRGAALGMRVLAHDPLRHREEIEAAGAKPTGLDILLVESDFVTLHAPPSPSRPLLGASELGRLKPGAALINVGRAGLVDEEALVSALHAGALAGAGLDVTAQEPLVPPSPLLGAPNLIVTPHAAWYSLESIVELRRNTAEEAARVLRGEHPRNPANEPRQRRARAAKAQALPER